VMLPVGSVGVKEVLVQWIESQIARELHTTFKHQVVENERLLHDYVDKVEH